MSTYSKITSYTDSRIDVDGHGESSTMPDRVTITFKCKIDSLEEDNIFTQIEKARDKFTDALEKEWAKEGDSAETGSYSLYSDFEKDSFSGEFEVRVTTSRLDELPKLIKLVEKYGGHVDYNVTEFDFTREKQQEQEDDAIKQALIHTEMAIHSFTKATGVPVSRVVNMKITNVIHTVTDYAIDTLGDRMSGRIMKMGKVTTTADILVTYLVEEE